MRWVKWVVGLIFSLGFGFLAFRGFSFQTLLAAVRQYHAGVIPVGLGLLIFEMGVRAWRWQLILQGSHPRPTRFLSVLSATWLCYFFNNILPGRAGDILRCHFLFTDEPHLSRSEILGTVVLERTFDGFSLITMFLFSLWIYPNPPQGIMVAARSVTVIYLFIAAGLMGMFFQRELFLDLVGRVCGFFPRLVGEKIFSAVNAVTKGLACIADPRQMAKVLVADIILWGTMVGVIHTWLQGAAQPLPFLAPIYLSMVAIGVMIPTAPGAVGSYHFFAREALLAFGATPDTAISLAVIVHGLPYLFVIGVGLLIILLRGIPIAPPVETPGEGTA